MNRQQEHHIIDILFVIALFCIFALSAVFLITVGANIYGKTVSHMEDNFNCRTSFAYVTEKIRQADQNGAVSVGELHELPAILITETVDDTRYITYLYQCNGYLKELMVREDTPLSPEAGQDILPVTEFSFEEVNDKLLAFTITTTDGSSCRLFVSKRSAGGDSTAK